MNYYQPYLEKSCSGSTNQTELKPAVISELFVPVPPVNEQIRIINKLIEALNLSKLYGEKEILLQKYNQDFPEQLKNLFFNMRFRGNLFHKTQRMNRLPFFWNAFVQRSKS